MPTTVQMVLRGQGQVQVHSSHQEVPGAFLWIVGAIAAAVLLLGCCEAALLPSHVR